MRVKGVRPPFRRGQRRLGEAGVEMQVGARQLGPQVGGLGAGYSGNANLGINSFAATNNTFQRVLGQSGVIEDWNCYGQGTASWGLGVLYDDGRVDACGDNNSYGETGTQVGNLHDVATLTNVIF